MICVPAVLLPQQQKVYTVKGKIFSSIDGRPVEFATVVLLEPRLKTQTNAAGFYSISVPEPGKYTLIVKTDGLKPITVVVNLTKDAVRDFSLAPMRGKGGTLIIYGERNIQRISRQTLTAEQIKQVPATFGDSLGALSTLPGIVRNAGLFGTLVVRGVNPDFNRFFIDDIPIFNPQHFFGIHSVISNDLIREIDLYSSAYPAVFGNAVGAIININTIDDVKVFGGNIDIGAISANMLIKTPFKPLEEQWNLKPTGDDAQAQADQKAQDKKDNGYFLVAGRIGYLPLIIPTIYEVVTGEPLFGLPNYWDYQVKTHYFFNSRHSMTFLAFGSKDSIDLNTVETPFPSEFDPLLKKFIFTNSQSSFSQGLYYTYEPSGILKNVFMFYAVLNDSTFLIDVKNDQVADWVKGFDSKSRPYIYGFKDKVRLRWLDKKAEMNAGLEYTIYDFIIDGYTIVNENYSGVGIPDFSDETLFDRIPFDSKASNHMLGGYLENKFIVSGFTIVPGFRFDYLERAQTATVDPRLNISYDFSSGTTLALSGGTYSSFYQTNQYIFVNSPNFALVGKRLKPNRAAHGSAGIEQKILYFDIKVEGFYNYYWNIAEEDASAPDNIRSSGRQKAYGLEGMFAAKYEKGVHAFFGWINYTYTQSKYRSGLSFQPAGHRYINYRFEQEHSLKLVAGYNKKNHSINARFQLNTSFPYTPIIGSNPSPDAPPAVPPTKRFVPVTDDAHPNSKHFPVYHRLDLRYTYTFKQKWGFVSMYIEIINIYNSRVVTGEDWDFEKPYKKGKNPGKSLDPQQLIPNFGVEAKF